MRAERRVWKAVGLEISVDVNHRPRQLSAATQQTIQTSSDLYSEVFGAVSNSTESSIPSPRLHTSFANSGDKPPRWSRLTSTYAIRARGNPTS